MKLKDVLFAGFIFSASLMMGCSNAGDGINNLAGAKETEFPPVMTGSIHVNDTEYEMASGNYRWEKKDGLSTQVFQTDAASPNQIAENFNAIVLEKDMNINIEIEDKPEISVFLWNENSREKQVKVNKNQFTTPATEGQYIYEVLAEWTNGEVSYTFVLEVK